jgi:signal transduction histidine kinase
MIEDITEQESLKEQLIIAHNLASLGLLAAGVAHEINSPLNIISYYLIDLMYARTQREQFGIIEGIEEEVKGIAEIVSNLASFSDSTKIKFEEFDFISLIAKLLSMIKHAASNRQIGIHFENAYDEITISANKTEIKQMILNIVRNSIDAMASGGDLYIKIREPDNILKRFEVAFADTGRGIAKEIMDSIFVPFISTKNAEANHMGLGLSITYGIVKKHKGEIYARNLTNGCEICVTLPFVRCHSIP